MVAKKGLKSGSDKLNFSDVEVEVYHLLSDEYLTPKQISIRRGVSPQRIYKIIQSLRVKGAFISKGNKGLKNTPPVSMKGFKNHSIITKLWRYHSLHFVIKPYYFFPRYHKIRKDLGNYGVNYRDWVVKLHPDMVELQLKSHEDFSSPDKWAATRKAEDSFNRTLAEISNKYGFFVWKEGKINIKLVNQELALNPSELANARKGDFLQIRGVDGYVWFRIDKSKGSEHEYTHPDRALGDSERVEPFLNDMLYNSPPTLSQITRVLKETVDVNKETASGLSAVVFYLKSQIPLKNDEDDLSNGNVKPDYTG